MSAVHNALAYCSPPDVPRKKRKLLTSLGRAQKPLSRNFVNSFFVTVLVKNVALQNYNLDNLKEKIYEKCDLGSCVKMAPGALT